MKTLDFKGNPVIILSSIKMPTRGIPFRPCLINFPPGDFTDIEMQNYVNPVSLHKALLRCVAGLVVSVCLKEGIPRP
jgi:hypothetical protein